MGTGEGGGIPGAGITNEPTLCSSNSTSENLSYRSSHNDEKFHDDESARLYCGCIVYKHTKETSQLSIEEHITFCHEYSIFATRYAKKPLKLNRKVTYPISA